MDKPFLKMKDDLPLKLFDPQNLIKLHEVNNKATFSYFFIPSITILCLKYIEISIDDRNENSNTFKSPDVIMTSISLSVYFS